MLIKQLSAKIRNIFSSGFFQKRLDNGEIQIKTVSGRILKKKEAFPYGFVAKAKNGKAFVFCQGGDFTGFEIMPIVADEKIKLPELKDGDTALYTESGGWMIARENGTVELFGADAGGLIKGAELKSQLEKMSVRLDGVINALKNSATGSQDGGATYKTQISAALTLLTNKEDFTKLESEKVLHGTGK